jgi:catechol 2,3-dioxygenase-like lactoylglutathione lyase family enzyme
MITGIHTLIYASNAAAARAFFRDTLKLPFVDAHDGWLIFALPPAELGVHPVEGPEGPEGYHTLSLMCDDIHATVADLKKKSVEFTKPVTDQGWGITTTLRIPGAGVMMLYQARHASPLKT